MTGNTAELFDSLSLNPTQGTQSANPSSPTRSRFENMPPRPLHRAPPPPGHHAQRSREEEARIRMGGKSDQLDIFADPTSPPKRAEHRPRRNSDPSLADRSSKHLHPDDHKRRERRERESRRPDGKRQGGSKSRQPSRRLDIIDKLDVTSIYGTGLFHHDGPFDACNPHRNRRGYRDAPMKAFPKDSMNNALGGSGPVNSNIDLNQFHGRGGEGYADYGNSAPVVRPGQERSMSFIATSRIEPVHGDESMGLGTSTFLEGAPASKTAIQRRESELDQQLGQVGTGGGIQRKKSLAQKIRGMSTSRPRPDFGRTTSPENYLERTMTPTSPMSTGAPISAGGRGKVNEKNAFFQDYDAAYDQKGVKIAAATEEVRAEKEKVGRTRTASSPRRGLGLERKITNDVVSVGGGEEQKSGGGGFLSRVKSLKGGRRNRSERQS